MLRIVPTLLAALLLIGGSCRGQSLGETARQMRQQKKKARTVANRVVTTDDLSTSPDSKPVPDPKPASLGKNDPQPAPYKTVGTAGFTPDMWAHRTSFSERAKLTRAINLEHRRGQESGHRPAG